MEKELESYHNRYYAYAVDGVLDIELKTTYAGSCVKDSTYGVSENRVWCRKNCGGNFIITVKV